MPSLAGQCAMVTGASRGIGRAIALELMRESVDVGLVARDVGLLDEVLTAGRSAGGRGVALQCELTEAGAVRDLTGRLSRDFDGVDILVHGAGAIAHGDLDAAEIEDLDSLFAVNVRAPAILTRAALPLLKERRGQVVFVNSTVGLNARSNVGFYAATKHALRALADSLREEVNPAGVRVLSVFLGRTATAMQERTFASEGRAYQPGLLMQPEDIASVVVNALRMPRTAEITDIVMRPMAKAA